MKSLRSLHVALLAAALSSTAGAAVPIVPVAGTFTYQQNFDTMFVPSTSGLVAASPGWTDNSTVPNWWFAYAANGTGAVLAGSNFAYFGSDGTSSISNALTLVSAGAQSSTERAFCTPPTTARGEQSGIVIFQNNGSSTVQLSRIQYNGELYRTNSTSGNTESIFVWQRTATSEAAALTLTTAAATTTVFPSFFSSSPTSQYISGWGQIDSARWTYTNSSGGSPINQTFPIDTTARGGISGVRIGPGQFLALRFSNVNDAATDALMGVDDVTLTFTEVAAPITPVVSNIVRNINGTPTVPTDDTVSFTLTVNNAGAPGTEWALSGPTTGDGPYGVGQTITAPISEFSAGDHSRTWTVTDGTDPLVTAGFSVIAPWCSLSTTISDFTYQDQGTPEISDDTVRYHLNPQANYGGASVLVDLGIGQQSFPYGQPIVVNSLPGAEVNFLLSDSADPACTASAFVNVPGVLGVNSISGTPHRLLSAPDTANNRFWAFDNFTPAITQNNAPQNGDRVVSSEVVDLTSTGEVRVTAVLDAIAGSSSGFEAADMFAIGVSIDGAAPVSILGASDLNGDGVLRGNTAGNGTELPDAGVTNQTSTFTFTTLIPASANSVQLRIMGNSNSNNETYVVRGIVLERIIIPFTTGNTSMGLKPGVAGKIALSSLTALAMNAEGPVSLTGTQAGATSGGATVTREGNWIIYQPAPGFTGIDNFTFTLSDGTNTASGHVTVAVDHAVGQTFNVLGITPEGTGQRITALGIPGRSYAWEYSADLLTWTNLTAPAPCPASGVITILDNGPLPATRYYRAVQR